MQRIFWLLVTVFGLVVCNVVLFLANRALTNWHYVISAQPGGLLYVTTFDDFNEDWAQYEGRLSAEVTDGVLRLSTDSPQSAPFSQVLPRFADFDVAMETRAVEGPVDNAFGLIFRLQDNANTQLGDNSYYLFLISSDGYYRVMRAVNGNEKVISDWIASDAINLGLDAVNELRVVGRGDQFRFFVNGQAVQLCIPDDPNGTSTFWLGECQGGQMLDSLIDSSIPTGQLGAIVYTTPTGGPGVVVEFDNVIIYQPEAA